MRHTWLGLLIFTWLLLSAGCNDEQLPVAGEALQTLPPASSSQNKPPQKATALPLIVLSASTASSPATGTLAPSIPGITLPVPILALTPTATLPAPMPPIEIPPEVQVVVLLGSDYEYPYLGRTDTILLAFANLKEGSTSLVSIPCDLYVYLPGQGMDRINAAYSNGGADLLFETLEYNLGVRPQHWALAHLDDFIRFVEDLGGIDVQVSTPLPNDCLGVPPGLFHMNGYVALCYVRSRITTSDFDRSRRQQEVLRAILHRFLSLDVIPFLPEWYTRYSQTIQSDMKLLDLLSYLPFALRLHGNDQIHHFQINWMDVTHWQAPETSAWVLVPKRERVSSIMQTAVDVLRAPVPLSPAEETHIAELIALLTATPTATPTTTPTP